MQTLARFNDTTHGVSFPRSRRRGIALLLVMIALIVGTILTAGFLGTQSTAIGIAHNQRDHDRCRMLAESGADLCMSLVRNTTGWRTSMQPGAWLTNYSLGGGTVSVTASDGANGTSFSTDTTQSVIFNSVATLNGRTYTVVASMTPTGGGTPWSGGTFTNNTIQVKDTASVDSFDSSLGTYLLSKSNSALFWSNVSAGNAMQISGGAAYQGTLTVSPNLSLGTAVNLSGGSVTGPSSVAAATGSRTAGNIIPPNTTGFLDTGADFIKTASFGQSAVNSIYNNFTVTGTLGTTITIGRNNSIYYVRGNMSVDGNSTLKVNPGVAVTFLVDGNVTIYGAVTLPATSQMQIYYSGAMDLYGSHTIGNTAIPSQLMIFGLTNASSLKIRQTSSVAAAIIAPNASLETDDSAQFYGSSISNQLTVQNTSKYHQDAKLQSASFHNVTGGSYAGDYVVRWTE